MNEYEILYIIHPRFNADEVSALADRVGETIREQGGEVLSVDHWGRRRLAYPIQHELEGSYVFSTFRMPPAGIAELESQLRIQREVIRSLVLKGVLTEPGSPPPDDVSRGRRQDAARAAAPDAASDEAPTSEAPASEAPASEAPASEAPASETPASEAPAEEAPAEEAPADEAPAESAPAESAPAEASEPTAPEGTAPAGEAAAEEATEEQPQAASAE